MRLIKFSWLLFLPFLVFASDRGNTLSMVSVSGGIVHPSFSTAVFQNPTDIMYSPGLNLNVQGGTNSSFGNPKINGGLLYGNSQIGVTGGVSDSVSSGTTNAYFGLGFDVQPLDAAFGIAGTTGISPSGGLTLNAGVKLNPNGRVILGFTAIGLNSGVQEWGGGIELNLGGAALVFDATVDSSFKTINTKPGLVVGTQVVALTASYGMQSGSNQITSGFTAGGSFKLGQKIVLEGYYNQLANIYSSLSIRL